jgi:cytochrome c553
MAVQNTTVSKELQQKIGDINRRHHMTDKQTIELSDDLIAEANEYLERLPKTPEQVIEHWAQLGQKLAGDMTELQSMQFLLGNLEVEMIKKE